MSKDVLLFTGFEPFGGRDKNPSIEACRLNEGKEYHGYKVVVEEIPLRYHEIQSVIERYIKGYEPAAVVCTGQGGGMGLAVERVAVNIASARMPYNCGYAPMDETLNSDGPAAYFSTLPFRQLVETMREKMVPARISNSAGAYGCNQIFYHLMDYVSKEKLDIPAGFIHVASTPDQVLERRGLASMSLDLTAKGLSIVAEELARRLRNA